MAGQEEDMQPSSKDSKAEVTVLREELQLVVKKEREAQVSVHTPWHHSQLSCCFSSHAVCVFVLRRRSWPRCVHPWPRKWTPQIVLTFR